MNAYRAFWEPIAGLIEAMESPFDASAILGILGWAGVLSAAAGVYLCSRRRNFGPLLVLAAILPCYLAIVAMFWPGLFSRHMHDMLIGTSITAGILALVTMVLGFVRSRGNRAAAVLFLPINVLFLLGLFLLAEAAVRQ